MRHDGDGWVICDKGHRHWGRYGAAGLLLAAPGPDGGLVVLLQLRASWSHEGGTWALPGGARNSDEDAVTAALREAMEEVGLDPASVVVEGVHRDDHGGWSYDTVIARTAQPLATTARAETTAVSWLPVEEVDGLALHPGFAATWPALRRRLVPHHPA